MIFNMIYFEEAEFLPMSDPFWSRTVKMSLIFSFFKLTIAT